MIQYCKRMLEISADSKNGRRSTSNMSPKMRHAKLSRKRYVTRVFKFSSNFRKGSVPIEFAGMDVSINAIYCILKIRLQIIRYDIFAIRMLLIAYLALILVYIPHLMLCFIEAQPRKEKILLKMFYFGYSLVVCKILEQLSPYQNLGYLVHNYFRPKL